MKGLFLFENNTLGQEPLLLDPSPQIRSKFDLGIIVVTRRQLSTVLEEHLSSNTRLDFMFQGGRLILAYLRFEDEAFFRDMMSSMAERFKKCLHRYTHKEYKRGPTSYFVIICDTKTGLVFHQKSEKGRRPYGISLCLYDMTAIRAIADECDKEEKSRADQRSKKVRDLFK